METYQEKWLELLRKLSGAFDADIDITESLYLIGVQELGQGFRKFSKQEKTDLIHIGNCTALSFFGYWQSLGRDADQWPQFRKAKELPPLSLKDQEALIKKGIIAYFESINFI